MVVQRGSGKKKKQGILKEGDWFWKGSVAGAVTKELRA
jgi:hypothetical protein